jgi:hypothetical protein
VRFEQPIADERTLLDVALKSARGEAIIIIDDTMAPMDATWMRSLCLDVLESPDIVFAMDVSTIPGNLGVFTGKKDVVANDLRGLGNQIPRNICIKKEYWDKKTFQKSINFQSWLRSWMTGANRGVLISDESVRVKKLRPAEKPAAHSPKEGFTPSRPVESGAADFAPEKPSRPIQPIPPREEEREFDVMYILQETVTRVMALAAHVAQKIEAIFLRMKNLL